MRDDFLKLVNGEYGLSEDMDRNLVTVGGARDVRLNCQAAFYLERLMEQIDGWSHIVPVSGWRSLEEQQKIWDDAVRENGLEFARRFVAAPGHSEHHTGLAIDLGKKQEEIDFLCPEFPYSGICQAFRTLAPYYGFIQRYPAGKEHVTGIGHEPWHFRYVGAPHAKIIAERNLTLEEYVLEDWRAAAG